MRDRYRNQLIEATRVGARVEAAAEALRGSGAEETARNFYRMVTTRIRSADSDVTGADLASAESTLADYRGSRTATLLALARAAGIEADVLLARKLEEARPAAPEPNIYRHPLVRFRFGDHEVLADAEDTGLAFGVAPSELAPDEALLVSLSRPEAAQFVSLNAAAADEQSVAQGDVNFDAEGNLSATVTIRMGSARGAQMRGILGGIAPDERRHFFEQLALRIFPGAMDADGSVANEQDAELPLELKVTCRAPHFLNLEGDNLEIEQLAPALGLRKIYGLGPRHFPLYVATPLVETTTFRVHLPAGLRVRALARNFEESNEFGSYSAAFRQTGPGEFEVRRSFRIPVQVIPPNRFDSFAQMSRRIDDAERQRLTLERVEPVAAARNGAR